ncbi:hypothetical protein Clacol_003400 [Clathrus columnatus]|uniref:Uncharacterized protein n=1 Tax=Clathrus columnatus TaxID=1419009 RepID=A0AAV5A952_9AGAM|nr:hypothetical protein Clacol_003400 [Clathrus columnatus]
MALPSTQKPSNSSPSSVSSSSTLRLSSFKPSEWRVQLISSSSSSSSFLSDSRSPTGPILAGRCYHLEQINQYYCPEKSEVFDLGGISDQNFYIKFERILDDHPTYVGIYLDEVLTDHFYIPSTEKWAISKGWQENPQWMYKYLWIPRHKTSRNSRISWDKNPRLVGHIIIRFYHLNEEEMKDLRETYITKRPPKCRYQNPRLNVYAGLDQNPTPISSLSPRKQRLSHLPMKVPYRFIYLRYDDVIRKAYGCELQLQTPYEEEEEEVRSSNKRKRTPEVKYESESDINHYILQPAPPRVKPKPKLKKTKPTTTHHYPAMEEFESEPDYRLTKRSKRELIPATEERYESDSDYVDIQSGPAKTKFKPTLKKITPSSTSNSKSKKLKPQPIVAPIRRHLPYSDLDRDDTTAAVASTSRTRTVRDVRVRNNNSNHKANYVYRRERERRYDGGSSSSRSHVKREIEDSGDELRQRRLGQQQKSKQRVQVQVTREQRDRQQQQQRQQGESELMRDVNFHMKEIWRILGNEAWKSLFG